MFFSEFLKSFSKPPRTKNCQAVFSLLIALAAVFAAHGQNETPRKIASQYNESNSVIVAESSETDVFGMGKSVVVRGEVKKGVMAFGGDVVVEGRVEGDVATIGGSVLQREGSFIGGDVIVFGGAYIHGKTAPGRNPSSQTIMYAGYETELREAMQNPASLVTPDFSAFYVGQRILAVLFWFLISLVVTAVSPGAVSRSIARLNLSKTRVALVGALAMIAMIFSVGVGLAALPTPVGIGASLMLTFFLLLAYVFGRVVVQAATGKFLLKILFGKNTRSESTALFLGAVFWTILLSLPFLGTLAFAGLLTVSLGLVLTARRAATPFGK